MQSQTTKIRPQQIEIIKGLKIPNSVIIHQRQKALKGFDCLQTLFAAELSPRGDKMRSAQKEVKLRQILTCEETYSMQSSSFDSIGIKPSLFTDRVGEFSF